MSGGFFRGTSADQDTRFSNKQAKLLKSQKFAPELDHLVDMRKVKMDVVRPWIATRATELLGFEDEVLINFIYGLLDGKEVDGKQIQIQLTGFMEKNTGKFMKELWSLLLSAQNNVSGVPQQFLDAKEEETRKKKEETDRIAQEIQKRREREGRHSRFDGESDISRASKDASDQVPKTRDSSVPPEEREVDERHGSRAKNGRSRSPHSNKHSPSPYRITPSPARLNNKTISRSRSQSEERRKSRSASVSSKSTSHSISPERQYRSPARRSPSPGRRYRSPPRSISPRRRHSPRPRSPLRRRSPFSRRRSRSRSRHRSPSPFGHRSPRRRRSPQYIHRRLPSPPRRRSRTPPRCRSPSPLRRRSPSPLHRRSPSPHRRSPVRARRKTPPLRRRSPIRRRSLSPVRHMSPSLKRRSPLPRSPKHQRRSPLRSPRNRNADSQNCLRLRNRSSSPDRSQSPSYQTRRSLSRERDSHIDGHESRRMRKKRSPVNHTTGRELAEHPGSGRKDLGNVSNKVPISVRSPQRDMGTQSEGRSKAPVVPLENSSSELESPTHVRKINLRTSRRIRSLSRSPGEQTRARMPCHDSPRAVREVEQTDRVREPSRHPTDSSHRRSERSPRDVGLKRHHANNVSPEKYSPDRKAARDQSPPVRGHPELLEERKKHSGHRSDMNPSERHAQQHSCSPEEIEYGPVRVNEERGSLCNADDAQQSSKSIEKQECNEQTVKSSIGDGYGVHNKKQSLAKGDENNESQFDTELATRSKKKADKRNQLHDKYSDSEETDSYSQKNVEKRRRKKSDKRKRDSDVSSEYDSQMDDKKEAKKRRKDEKRLRKEERRRRREERHRKRLDRRAGKQKVKSMDTVTPPSDFEKNHTVADESDDDPARRQNSIPSDMDEAESEQKKLEIELRKKALESLRAKKAISH